MKLNKETIEIIANEIEKGNEYHIHENKLTKRVMNRLNKIKGLTIEDRYNNGFKTLFKK